MSTADLLESLQCLSSAMDRKSLQYLNKFEKKKLSSENEIKIVHAILYEAITQSREFYSEKEIGIIKHCTEFLIARWKQKNSAPSFDLDHLLFEGLKRMIGRSGMLHHINELTDTFIKLFVLPGGCHPEISRHFSNKLLNCRTGNELCSCSLDGKCELLSSIHLQIEGIKISYFTGIFNFSRSVRQLSNILQSHLEIVSSVSEVESHLSAVEKEVSNNMIPALCSGSPVSSISSQDLTQDKKLSCIIQNILQLGLQSSISNKYVEETISTLYSDITEFLRTEEVYEASKDSDSTVMCKACAVALGLLLPFMTNGIITLTTDMDTAIQVTRTLLSQSSSFVDLFLISQVFHFCHSVLQVEGTDSSDKVVSVLSEILTIYGALFVDNDEKKQSTAIKIVQYGLIICTILFNSNQISFELVLLLKRLLEILSSAELRCKETSQSKMINLGILLARCHRNRRENLDAMEAVESCIIKLPSYDNIDLLIVHWTKAKIAALKNGMKGLQNRTLITKLKEKISEDQILILLLAEIESYKSLSNSEKGFAAAAINEAISYPTLPNDRKLPLLCGKIIHQYEAMQTFDTESDIVDIFQEAYALCTDKSATWESFVQVKLIHFFQDWMKASRVSLQNLYHLVECYAEAATCSYNILNIKNTTDICYMAFVSLRLFGEPIQALSLLLAMNQLVEKQELQNKVDRQLVSKSLCLLSCLISDSFSVLEQPLPAEKYAKKALSECEKLSDLPDDNETSYLTFLSRLTFAKAIRQSSQTNECDDILRQCFNDAFVGPEKAKTSHLATMASVKLYLMAGKMLSGKEPSICSLLMANKKILMMMAKLNPLIYNGKCENLNKCCPPFSISSGDSNIDAVMQLTVIEEVLCCLHDISGAYLRLGDARKTLCYQKIGLEITNALSLQKWELKFQTIKFKLYSVCLREDKIEQFSNYICYRISCFEKEDLGSEYTEPKDNVPAEDVFEDINRRLISPYSQMGSNDSDAIPVYSKPMDIDSYVSKSKSVSASPDSTRHTNFKEKMYPLPQLFEHTLNCKCQACSNFDLISIQFDYALILAQYCLLTGRLKEGLKICKKLSGRVEKFARIKIDYQKEEKELMILRSHVVACNLVYAELYYYQKNEELSMQVMTKVEHQLEVFNMDKFSRTHLEAKADLLKALLIQPFPLLLNKNTPLDQLNILVDSLSACHLSEDNVQISTPVLKKPRPKGRTVRSSARRQLLNTDTTKTPCKSRTPCRSRKKSTLETAEKFQIFSDSDSVTKTKKKDVRKKKNTLLPVPELPNVGTIVVSSEYDFISSDIDSSPVKASNNIMQARKVATRRHRKKFAPIYTTEDPEKLRVMEKNSSTSRKIKKILCQNNVPANGSSSIVNTDLKIKHLFSALTKANVVSDFWLVKQSSQALSNAYYHLNMERIEDHTSVKATAYHLFSFGVSSRTVIYANTSNKFLRLEKGFSEEERSSKQYITWLSETVRDYNPIYSLSQCADDTNSYINGLTNYIPAGWTACAISLAKINNDSATFLSRLEKGCVPVHMQIPGKKIQDLLDSFDNIMDRNMTTMKSRDKSNWWTQRRNVDGEMKTLLENLAQNTLGPFRGMLLGNVMDSDQHYLILSDVKTIAKRFQLNDVKQQELYMFFNSWYCLNAEEKLLASAHLSGNVNSSEAVEISTEIERMSAKYQMDKLPRHHVILILDKEVHRLPWESLPLLQTQSTTRLPSADILKMQLKLLQHSSNTVASEGVNLNDVSYVINPKGDLVKTQNRLVDWFYNLPTWKGIVSRAPSSTEWAKSVTDFDLFIYCGHGSGENYMPPEGFLKINTRAVSLLMGCSSGKLEQGGILEPDGIVVCYLMSGAPCVLACLWPVTDKDIDKYLAAVLTQWSSNKDCNETLPVCARKAESVCKIRTNGFACVVYGLPVHCQISIAKFIESMPVGLLEK